MQEALARRVTLSVDEALLDEFRDVVGRPEVARKRRILVTRVDALMEELRKVAGFIKDVPARFTYARDPDEAHYVNLARAAAASLIVSRDKDLLNLMDERNEDGRAFRERFPSLRVRSRARKRGFNFLHLRSGGTAESHPFFWL